MFKEDLLKGKRILVTGGGTGLGKEMASHYAEHGADIFICGRRENVLKDTASELEDKYGVSVAYESLDIRASKDVDDYIGRIFLSAKLGLVNHTFSGPCNLPLGPATISSFIDFCSGVMFSVCNSLILIPLDPLNISLRCIFS